MTSVKGITLVEIDKMQRSLVNTSAHAKFDDNPLLRSQNFVRKQIKRICDVSYCIRIAETLRKHAYSKILKISPPKN